MSCLPCTSCLILILVKNSIGWVSNVIGIKIKTVHIYRVGHSQLSLQVVRFIDPANPRVAFDFLHSPQIA
jgi:hypothetical protein